MAEKSNFYSYFQPFLKNFEMHFIKDILLDSEIFGGPLFFDALYKMGIHNNG